MMRSQRVRNRSRNASPAIAAAFACADAVVEATRRGLCRNAETTKAEEALAASSGEVFVLLGRELERRRRSMLAADDRYQQLRARQRRFRYRRDEVARRAYRGLVAARKILKGLFGYEGACDYLGLRGPTVREPPDLCLQLGEAVWWARHHDADVEPLHDGAEKQAKSCVDGLERLWARLDHALRDALRGGREVEAAMLEQRATMAAFDHAYRHVAGALEARLIQVGLPTLAAAVRPGVGRRGRPRKQRPVDLHPDLVEQVRVRGLIGLDLEDANLAGNELQADSTDSKPSSSGSAHDVLPRTAAGDGDAADGSVANDVRNGSERLEIIEQLLPERSTDEEIIEQPLPERFGDEEIIVQAVPECSGGEEESRHLVRKQNGGDSKIEQPLRKPDLGGPSRFKSALTLPPPVVACGRDPRKRDRGGRSYRVERRPAGPAEGRPPLEEVRKVASWWGRLLRSA